MATTSGITRFKRLNTNIHPTPQSEDDALLYELRDGTRWISSAAGRMRIAEETTGIFYVRSQEDFQKLYESETWLDAETVVFDGSGGVVFERDTYGLRVPATVKSISGINNATIQINEFAYNADTNPAALWYSASTSSGGYSIDNLIVNCNPKWNAGNDVYCFYRCDSLTECVGRATSGSSDLCSGYAFYQCRKLANCRGYGFSRNTISNSGITTRGAAFKNCTILTDCYGSCEVTNSYYPVAGSAFDNCRQLTNCEANCSGTNAYGDMRSYGFENCSQLANCIGAAGIQTTTEPSTFSRSMAFFNCIQLSNCRGSGGSYNLGTNYGYGFYDCSYASTCRIGLNACTTAIWGGTNTYIDPNTCEGYN